MNTKLSMIQNMHIPLNVNNFHFHGNPHKPRFDNSVRKPASRGDHDEPRSALLRLQEETVNVPDNFHDSASPPVHYQVLLLEVITVLTLGGSATMFFLLSFYMVHKWWLWRDLRIKIVIR